MPKKSKGRSRSKVKSREGRLKRSFQGNWKRSTKLLILLSAVFILIFLFHDNIRNARSYKVQRLSANEIVRRIDTLNENIEGVFSFEKIKEKGIGSSYSIKETGSSIYVVPQRKEFILPGGMGYEELLKLLHEVTGEINYGIAIRNEGKNRKSFNVGIDIDAYKTHNFTFFYSPGETTPEYRIAIVIDDLGFSIDRARELLNLKIPISFAVLPYRAYSTEIANEASAMGRDVLLHLPMEPVDYPKQDPGEGSVFLSMSDEEIAGQVARDIEAVPHVIGVNNHMGSKFSENREKMAVVLNTVKEKKLFFLDSKTSPKTTGFSLAKEIGLRALDRNVFLDNDRDIAYTLTKLEELIEIAKKHGSAIAIGHPHPTTIAALEKMVERFESEGIEVVPISSLLD